MSAFIEILGALSLLIGSAFCLIGAAGLLRMPDFYTRLHAASLIETAGAGFILFGLLLQAGFSLIAAKLLMIALLILFAGPTASHALARAALLRGLKPAGTTHPGEPPSKP